MGADGKEPPGNEGSDDAGCGMEPNAKLDEGNPMEEADAKPRFPPEGKKPRFPPEGKKPRFPPEGKKPRFPPEGKKPRFPPEGKKPRFPPEGIEDPEKSDVRGKLPKEDEGPNPKFEPPPALEEAPKPFELDETIPVLEFENENPLKFEFCPKPLEFDKS